MLSLFSLKSVKCGGGGVKKSQSGNRKAKRLCHIVFKLLLKHAQKDIPSISPTRAFRIPFRNSGICTK